MNVDVVVDLTAKLDILDAAAWYEGERPGLSAEFLDDIQRVFDRIGDNPLQFPVVQNDARRALARRFPYAIYFKVDARSARVKAVLHQHRSPDVFRSRIERDG